MSPTVLSPQLLLEMKRAVEATKQAGEMVLGVEQLLEFEERYAQLLE